MKRQMSGDYQDDFEDDAKILIIRMMVKMMRMMMMMMVMTMMMLMMIGRANMPHLTTYRSLWTDLDKKVKIGMNITMQF